MIVGKCWDDSLDPTTAPYGVLMSAATYWEKMTPEERSAEMKRRMGTRKSNKKGKRKHTKRASTKKQNTHAVHRLHDEDTHDGQAQAHISYIYGKVETIIEYYANSNGISKSTLAKGVADLLRR